MSDEKEAKKVQQQKLSADDEKKRHFPHPAKQVTKKRNNSSNIFAFENSNFASNSFGNLRHVSNQPRTK